MLVLDSIEQVGMPSPITVDTFPSQVQKVRHERCWKTVVVTGISRS